MWLVVVFVRKPYIRDWRGYRGVTCGKVTQGLVAFYLWQSDTVQCLFTKVRQEELR